MHKNIFPELIFLNFWHFCSFFYTRSNSLSLSIYIYIYRCTHIYIFTALICLSICNISAFTHTSFPVFPLCSSHLQSSPSQSQNHDIFIWGKKTSIFFWSVPTLASGHEQVQAHPDSNVICKTEQLQPRVLNGNGNCYWFPKHRGCAPHLHDKSVSRDWGLRGNSSVCKHELVVYINTIYSTTPSMVKSRKIQEESASGNQRYSQQEQQQNY